MKPIVKMYGERNVGTNYLTRLISKNLDVEQLPGVVPDRLIKLQQRSFGEEWLRDLYFTVTWRRNLGWKHALVNSPQVLAAQLHWTAPLYFVTLTKNPYSWLLSLHRRPYHTTAAVPSSFEKFLNLPWQTVRREQAPKWISSPVDLWNIKNRAYLALGDGGEVEHIRYEDLLRNPAEVIDILARRFKLSRHSSGFVNIEKSTKQDRGKGFAYYQDYYLNEHWREALSADAAAWINSRLDKQVVERFGYQLIDPNSLH